MSWSTTPTRFVLTEVDERAGAERCDLPLLGVTIAEGVVRRSDTGSTQAASEDVSHYKVCQTDDIVINRMRAFQGAVGRSSEVGLVSPDYAVMRPASAVHPRFLHYQMRSSWFVSEMTRRLRGIGDPSASQVRTPRINTEDLGRIDMFTPTPDVQRRVADMLDAETARIDQLIAKNSQVIELLGLRLRSQAAALTLPQETDKLVPLRFAAQEVSVKASAPLRETLTLDRVVSWSGHVQPFDGTEEEGEVVGEGKAYEPGDVLFSKLRPYLAKAVLATKPGVANPEFLVYRPFPQLDSAYLHLTMLSPAFVSWATAMSYGTKMPRTNAESLGRFALPLPDRGDQWRRTEALVAARVKSTMLTDHVRQQTALLEARRQALITAAVTGQIDV